MADVTGSTVGAKLVVQSVQDECDHGFQVLNDTNGTDSVTVAARNPFTVPSQTLTVDGA